MAEVSPLLLDSATALNCRGWALPKSRARSSTLGPSVAGSSARPSRGVHLARRWIKSRAGIRTGYSVTGKPQPCCSAKCLPLPPPSWKHFPCFLFLVWPRTLWPLSLPSLITYRMVSSSATGSHLSLQNTGWREENGLFACLRFAGAADLWSPVSEGACGAGKMWLQPQRNACLLDRTQQQQSEVKPPHACENCLQGKMFMALTKSSLTVCTPAET